VKASARVDPPKGPGSVIVEGVTLSKLPTAEDINEGDTMAVMSPLVLPIVFTPGGRGGFGSFEGGPHGTSRHSLLGYSLLKQPFFGSGTREIASLQALRVFALSGVTATVPGVLDVIGSAARAAENKKTESNIKVIVKINEFKDFMYGSLKDWSKLVLSRFNSPSVV
jgi:hypothetical protein